MKKRKSTKQCFSNQDFLTRKIRESISVKRQSIAADEYLRKKLDNLEDLGGSEDKRLRKFSVKDSRVETVESHRSSRHTLNSDSEQSDSTNESDVLSTYTEGDRENENDADRKKDLYKSHSEPLEDDDEASKRKVKSSKSLMPGGNFSKDSKKNSKLSTPDGRTTSKTSVRDDRRDSYINKTVKEDPSKPSLISRKSKQNFEEVRREPSTRNKNSLFDGLGFDGSLKEGSDVARLNHSIRGNEETKDPLSNRKFKDMSSQTSDKGKKEPSTLTKQSFLNLQLQNPFSKDPYLADQKDFVGENDELRRLLTGRESKRDGGKQNKSYNRNDISKPPSFYKERKDTEERKGYPTYSQNERSNQKVNNSKGNIFDEGKGISSTGPNMRESFNKYLKETSINSWKDEISNPNDGSYINLESVNHRPRGMKSSYGNEGVSNKDSWNNGDLNNKKVDKRSVPEEVTERSSFEGLAKPIGEIDVSVVSFKEKLKSIPLDEIISYVRQSSFDADDEGLSEVLNDRSEVVFSKMLLNNIKNNLPKNSKQKDVIRNTNVPTTIFEQSETSRLKDATSKETFHCQCCSMMNKSLASSPGMRTLEEKSTTQNNQFCARDVSINVNECFCDGGNRISREYSNSGPSYYLCHPRNIRGEKEPSLLLACPLCKTEGNIIKNDEDVTADNEKEQLLKLCEKYLKKGYEEKPKGSNYFGDRARTMNYSLSPKAKPYLNSNEAFCEKILGTKSLNNSTVHLSSVPYALEPLISQSGNNDSNPFYGSDFSYNPQWRPRSDEVLSFMGQGTMRDSLRNTCNKYDHRLSQSPINVSAKREIQCLKCDRSNTFKNVKLRNVNVSSFGEHPMVVKGRPIWSLKHGRGDCRKSCLTCLRRPSANFKGSVFMDDFTAMCKNSKRQPHPDEYYLKSWKTKKIEMDFSDEECKSRSSSSSANRMNFDYLSLRKMEYNRFLDNSGPSVQQRCSKSYRKTPFILGNIRPKLSEVPQMGVNKYNLNRSLTKNNCANEKETKSSDFKNLRGEDDGFLKTRIEIPKDKTEEMLDSEKDNLKFTVMSNGRKTCALVEDDVGILLKRHTEKYERYSAAIPSSIKPSLSEQYFKTLESQSCEKQFEKWKIN